MESVKTLALFNAVAFKQFALYTWLYMAHRIRLAAIGELPAHAAEVQVPQTTSECAQPAVGPETSRKRSVIEQLRALEQAGQADRTISDRLMQAVTEWAASIGAPPPTTIFDAIRSVTEALMTEKERIYGVEHEQKALGCVCAWLDGVRYCNVSCKVVGHMSLATDDRSTDYVFRLGNTEVPVYENTCLVLNGATEDIERFMSPATAQHRFDTLPVDDEYPIMLVLVMRVKGGVGPE